MQFILRYRTKISVLFVTLLTFAWAVYAVQDRGFWTEAAQSGMAEVALGNLGVQKAQSERVKQFAEQMVRDHTAVNEELKSIAAGKNVTLPTTASAKHQATHNKLSGLSGAEFDREFMKVMVKNHRAAVKLFEKQSRSDGDAEAKAFAAKNLPALQGHLQMAQTISGETKHNSSDKSSNGDSNRSGTSNTNSNRR